MALGGYELSGDLDKEVRGWSDGKNVGARKWALLMESRGRRFVLCAGWSARGSGSIGGRGEIGDSRAVDGAEAGLVGEFRSAKGSAARRRLEI